LLGKRNFDVAEHVVLAGRLEDVEVAYVGGVPIHGRRIDVAPAALDAQVVEGEDARAATYQAG
jgi:hypothetical protein